MTDEPAELTGIYPAAGWTITARWKRGTGRIHLYAGGAQFGDVVVYDYAQGRPSIPYTADAMGRAVAEWITDTGDRDLSRMIEHATL